MKFEKKRKINLIFRLFITIVIFSSFTTSVIGENRNNKLSETTIDCADELEPFVLFIDAEATGFGFNNTEIKLPKDTCVNLTFRNLSPDSTHDITIDDDPEINLVGFELVLADVNSGSINVAFHTPNLDIDIHFYCKQPGHESLGMIGTFIIGAGSSAELIDFAPLQNNINLIGGNLIAQDGSIIPFTAQFVFILLIILLFVILLLVTRKAKKKNVLTSFSILLMFSVLIVAAPLPNVQDVRPEKIDVYGVMTAQLKPWTFNLTLLDGVNGERDCNIDDIMLEIKINPTRGENTHTHANHLHNSCNDLVSSDYSTDEGLNGAVRINEIRISIINDRTENDFIVFALTMVALDTEHGLTFPNDDIRDTEGEYIEKILAQRVPTNIYMNIPNKPGTYLFRCSFFCGAGHQDMSGSIIVE